MTRHWMKSLVALLFVAGYAGHLYAEAWIDVTEQYIVNPDFRNNDVRTGWEGTRFGVAGPMNNAEHFSKNFDTYQRIEGLQPGRYRLSASAFYRMGQSFFDYWYYTSGDYEEFLHAQLYATSSVQEASVAIVPASSAALPESLGGSASQVGWDETLYIPNNMAAAHYWFEAGYYHNEVEVEVGSDGRLTIGVRKETTIDSDWMCISNWRLEMWGETVLATAVSVSPASLTLVKGESQQLTAKVEPANATIQSVEWSSDNPAVASVDRNGLVTAEGDGEAHITATTADGSDLNARCTVKVTNNDAGLRNVIVTEIMAANLDQMVDPSWNYGGWVELYNPSALTVTLTGCWLSDDPQQLQKVHISQPTIIPGKGYKNLWFEHHDKYCLTQMDMKLDVEGGKLYLSDEAGQLILAQQYPPAVSRCSYARKSLTGNTWGWSSTPTPEAANTGMTYAEVRLPAPDIDQPTQVFDASLNVCVNIPEGATLRYTTDGTAPTATNGETSETGLFSIDETTTFRFCLIGDGYLPSPVVTRSYLLRDKEFALPVLSVVGNDYDLYGDDMGIMVRGNGNGRPGNGQSSPCNWNMDWDRTVNTEFLNTEGEMVINQETAIERCGGWSRAWAPYAFKLKANKRYELQSYLPYDFFPDKPYRKHKTLQIRNGGNDTQCRIKDPALQEIVARSGIDIDCQGYQPIMHYINGRYAGVINMREPNNKHFVYANYGLDDDEIDQFEMSPDSGYVQKCGTRESLQRWYDLAEECGDSDEAYDEIRQMVDIDEYCNYMAVQFYLGNWDWPQNNVKAFKPIMEGGKFRFVLFDLDGSMNLGTSEVFSAYANKQRYTFDQLYGEPVSHYTKEIEVVTIFLNMLKNERFRKQFIDTYCLVAGSVFEPTRCRDIINELVDRVSESQNIWDEVYWQRSTPRSTANTLIGALTSSRQQTMVTTLRNYSPMQLRSATMQRVSLSANIPEARLWVNGLPVPTNKFSGRLFAPVTFRAAAPAGYRFVGWKSNEEIVGTDEEYEMPTGTLTLVACYEEMTPEEKREAGLATTPVVINEVSAGNSIYINEYGKKDDWIELYNTTDEDIDLEGMYLTDRSEKPEKCQITAQGTRASTILPAHGYKIVWCSKRETDSELHVDFKLDNADSTVVRLMAKDRSWADSLVYCAHNGDQTVGRYPDGGRRVYLMTQPTIRKANLLNTYAQEWNYVSPTPVDGIRTMASRNAGMSIAYQAGSLLVKSEESQTVVLSIYTPAGAVVVQSALQLEGGHQRVSVANLPNGIYVASARDAEGNECTTKFVRK